MAPVDLPSGHAGKRAHSRRSTTGEFGLDGPRRIDPACGSGHFLLGAFSRLVAAWREQSPTLDDYELAHRALGSVHGVDTNPFAVAIARFRRTDARRGVAAAVALLDSVLLVEAGLPRQGGTAVRVVGSQVLAGSDSTSTTGRRSRSSRSPPTSRSRPEPTSTPSPSN